MSLYLRSISSKATPQSQSIFGRADMEVNDAGGYGWKVDDWEQFERFLFMGSESGCYYVNEQTLTKQNAEATLRCIKSEGLRLVERIVEVSWEGRAAKQDPGIFALAMAASFGEPEVRHRALEVVPKVCRYGTALLNFVSYVQGFRGWGRGLRSALAEWYQLKSTKDLAYQLVKYQSRDGWSQRDLIRLSHPKPVDEGHQILYYWAVKGWPGVGDEPHPNPDVNIVWAFEKAKRATSESEIIDLIATYKLPREAVPTNWLKYPAVWETLLEDMPMTAMIRNLATMTRIGLLEQRSEYTKKVVNDLSDTTRLKRARIHPIAILIALKTYSSGHSVRGDSTWTPVQKVCDALDEAFYGTFSNVEPTNKRILVAVDCSGSMMGEHVVGCPNISAREAGAAMALITLATEPNATVIGFDDKLYDLGDRVKPTMRLDDVVNRGLPRTGNGTDCSLPILGSIERKLDYDLFIEYTDNQSWAGEIHTSQVLDLYRKERGIDAKMIAAALTAENSSICDPTDRRSINIAGLDANVPQVIREFAMK